MEFFKLTDYEDDFYIAAVYEELKQINPNLNFDFDFQKSVFVQPQKTMTITSGSTHRFLGRAQSTL